MMDIFQIGYNMGRLQELRGDGREEWWDAYKGMIEKKEWGQLKSSIMVEREQLRNSM